MSDDETDYEELIKNSYQFKNYYDDSIYKVEYNNLNEIFYNGNSPYIIIKDCKWFNNGDYDKIIYYTIKNYSNQISYGELFDQLDNQSINYLDILLNDDHRFIESIDQINDITYELCCGS